MTLAEFIGANLERLLSEWEEFARTLPATAGMDVQELRDGAKAILCAVAEDLKSFQTMKHRREKSRGRRPEASAQLTETGRHHAAQRLSANFTLDELVSEYRAFRTSVTSVLSSSDESIDEDEVARFHEALDQALMEAVCWFNNRLERSRNMFVGILGHDLRNPLGAISASADLALATDDLDILREAAARIRRSTDQMRELIDVLLDFSRTRLGERLPLSRKKTDLAAVCKQVTQDFSYGYPKQKIRSKCRGPLTGFWDEARLAQALSNLIKNALDYGKRSGTVTVSCTGRRDRAELSVHNEGRPIALSKQREIFEPLSRGQPDDESRYSAHGTGLGLYIVDQIALAHGGSVELTSNAREGTTFIVRLPRGDSGD